MKAQSRVVAAAVVALSGGFFVRAGHAQSSTTVAELGVVATSVTTDLESQPLESSAAASPAADEKAEGSSPTRYPPLADVWEVGAFTGPLFISDRNTFRGAVAATANGPIVGPFSTYAEPAIELGVRGAYFPFAFVGAEIEGLVARGASERGQATTVWGARGHVLLQSTQWSVVPFLLGGAGLWHVMNDVSGADTDPALHFGGGAKFALTRELGIRVDLRDTLTSRRSGGEYPHHVEALVGASWLLGGTGPSVADSDRDALPDGEDQCPSELGVQPRGCPVRDQDDDGIQDASDECPEAAGLVPTGCPPADNPGDGTEDALKKCSAESGAAPAGCPDSDSDSVLEREPPEPSTVNTDTSLTVAEEIAALVTSIAFETNGDTLGEEARGRLDKVAQLLLAHPDVLVEVVGHTDDQGDRHYNFGLSQRRAVAVKDHLIAAGVNVARISLVGAGPDRPRVPNDTLEGRRQNRRIELQVSK